MFCFSYYYDSYSYLLKGEVMIYNRKEKKYYDVEESKILTFLYKTIIGRILLKLVTQRWVTNLYAKYTRSKISKHKINKFINDNHINI